MTERKFVGVELLFKLLRQQLSTYVFGMHSTLAITNRDILADRATIIVDSVNRYGTALLRDSGVCCLGDLILNNYCG